MCSSMHRCTNLWKIPYTISRLYLVKGCTTLFELRGSLFSANCEYNEALMYPFTVLVSKYTAAYVVTV